MNNLQQVQQQLCEKRRLEAKLSVLRSQDRSLELRAAELKRELESQQGDVERLEGVSLASVFYSMIGKKTERLDKEKAEAYAAKLKYDTAAMEQERVHTNILSIEQQLRALSGLEDLYGQLLQEKAKAIRESGTHEAEKILNMEKCIAQKHAQKKEIGEAISAGNRALNTANDILSNLDDAEGWGIWDLAGGGLVSDLVKHSYLDEAQEKVQKLQEELRCFKTELTDVAIDGEIQVSVEGFLRFADYFFDGLFADWAVLDKISQSQSSVTQVQGQIRQLLSNLNRMMDTVNGELGTLEKEKESLIVQASI